uniref:Unnamed protein product n=1 Tax=Macaca fascicularis TaxID=9541 RepID=Q9N0A3_MACFA|nr:unnamed protein product [Macaca fascicularis]
MRLCSEPYPAGTGSPLSNGCIRSQCFLSAVGALISQLRKGER